MQPGPCTTAGGVVPSEVQAALARAAPVLHWRRVWSGPTREKCHVEEHGRCLSWKHDDCKWPWMTERVRVPGEIWLSEESWKSVDFKTSGARSCFQPTNGDADVSRTHTHTHTYTMYIHYIVLLTMGWRPFEAATVGCFSDPNGAWTNKSSWTIA